MTAQLDSGENLANEDILWTGALVCRGAQLSDTSGQRPMDVIDVDVKAKRRFESAEERLVLEAMPLSGDGSAMRIVCVLRALIMF